MFLIGKTDEDKHELRSAEDLTTSWLNRCEQNQRVFSRVCKGYLSAVQTALTITVDYSVDLDDGDAPPSDQP